MNYQITIRPVDFHHLSRFHRVGTSHIFETADTPDHRRGHVPIHWTNTMCMTEVPTYYHHAILHFKRTRFLHFGFEISIFDGHWAREIYFAKFSNNNLLYDPFRIYINIAALREKQHDAVICVAMTEDNRIFAVPLSLFPDQPFDLRCPQDV